MRSVTGILNLAIDIYTAVIFAAIIISWVAPGSRHPLVQLVQRATEPVFSTVRKLLPDLGGIDLSPVVVLLALRGIQRYIL